MVRGYYAGAGLVYQGGSIQAKEMGGSNYHSLYRRGGRDGLRGGCGEQRVEVGELQTESRSVEPENAEFVRANLRIDLGELNLMGGADSLIEAIFAHNVVPPGSRR